MLAVGWSWDARVMGVVVGIPPEIWGSGASVAVQGGVSSILTSLALIGGGIHVRFTSATYPWLLTAPLTLHRVRRCADDTRWFAIHYLVVYVLVQCIFEKNPPSELS